MYYFFELNLIKIKKYSDLKMIKFYLFTFVINCFLISELKSEKTIYLFNNVRITLTYTVTRTSFLVSTPFDNGIQPSNAWLGIGLNSNSRMVLF